MSGTARVAAQAKVNLTLRVLEREASGYHQIETVFQRLALADIVNVRTADGRSLDTRWTGPGAAPDLGPIEQNLAWRAADAYARATGWPGGFAIEVEKMIPVGGGLGGGSPPPAAVLRGLDALAPRPVGAAALVDIGSRLGADVAFLASPSELALAWGRGERMLDLPPLPEAPVLLVIPDFGVGTAQAYDALARHRLRVPLPAGAAWRSPRALGSWTAVAADAVNDFESVVFDDHPALATMRARLAALPATVFAMMSGSGSTLFAVQTGAVAGTGTLALPAGWTALMTSTAAQREVTVR